MTRLSLTISGAMLIMSTSLSSCGKDDKDKETTTEPCSLGDRACSFSSADSAITLDFSEASVGDKYVILPTVLGTGDGATADKFDLTVTGAKAASSLQYDFAASNDLEPLDTATPDSLLEQAKLLDHAQRTVFQRFRTNKSMAQEPGFWDMVAQVDKMRTKLNHQQSLSGQPANQRSLKELFTNTIQNGHDGHNLATPELADHAANALAADCPTTEVVVPYLNNGGIEYDSNETSDVLDSVSEDHYCIAYVSDSNLSGGSKSLIAASIKKVVDTYRDTIYKTDFPAISGFTFKPIFVVIDFSDINVWPMANDLQVAGVVLPEMNTGAGRPIIYMSSDYTKLPNLQDANSDQLKTMWHGTLAHEMHHAIVDYYKMRVHGKSGETIAIDEGLAHFMEDVFGYGESGFSDYAGSFLSGIEYGITAILNSTNEVATSGADRGASHALMYYLASQKGGMTFGDDGIVAGGGGLDYIKSVVTSEQTGVDNLASQFGESWANMIGNYLAALVLDGSGLTDISSIYDAQDPVTRVANLTGSQESIFGMRFNKWPNKNAALRDYQLLQTAGKIEDQTFYQSTPFIHTVEESTDKIVISAPTGNLVVTTIKLN